MLTDELRQELKRRVDAAAHPRELAVDVLTVLQEHFGYLGDEALREAGDLLGMTVMEIEELATFYTFLYREPVGRFVIHVCDSLVCWMEGYETLRDHLMRKLNIGLGETTADGLFTLLPVCCIGYCDRAPAMLVNRKVYGGLTPEKVDELLERFRRQAQGAPDASRDPGEV